MNGAFPHRIFPTLFGLCLACATPCDQDLGTFPLAHRLPEELIPLLQPLLDPGDVLIPARGSLILRASPEKVNEIAAVIGQLDRAPHRLLITVAQASSLTASGLDLETRLRGQTGTGGVQAGFQDHLYSLEGRNTQGGSERVQTLDGHPAIIQMGGQFAVPAPSPFGTGIRYLPVNTGFSVLPRIAGSEVVLEIAPWSERLNRYRGDLIDTRNAHATVRARLGEWIEVGGMTDRAVGETSHLAGHSYSTRSRDDRILLRVEDLDAGQP
jgi:hypothetical protein